MLQAHLGGILNLRRRTAKELASGSRSHGASHAHLTLATDVGTRYGCVLLNDVAYKPRSGEGMKNLLLGEAMARGKMV